jgi:Tfp pilus assembly protein PilN
MIRINLLSEGRRPVVARRAKAAFSLGEQDPSLLFVIAGLVLGLLAGGALWWLKKTEIAKIDGQIAQAQAEVNELQEIIDQVERFKAQQIELKTKIGVIQDLKQKQKGPVKIMAAISRALPELLWINSLRLSGTSVQLRGQAFNTNAVASFIGALNEVPEFLEPDTKDIVKVRGDRELYSYNLNFSFAYKTAAVDEDGDGVPDEPEETTAAGAR